MHLDRSGMRNSKTSTLSALMAGAGRCLDREVYRDSADAVLCWPYIV
jgi:hypothetical protein